MLSLKYQISEWEKVIPHYYETYSHNYTQLIFQGHISSVFVQLSVFQGITVKRWDVHCLVVVNCQSNGKGKESKLWASKSKHKMAVDLLWLIIKRNSYLCLLKKFFRIHVPRCRFCGSEGEKIKKTGHRRQITDIYLYAYE